MPLAVPMGKNRVLLWHEQHLPTRNQAARVPQANRVPAIPKSWTRSIPRRSPAYCVKYRRDIACFIMAILAVLFCASEWFRVQGAFGQVLHAMASGLFGLTSVILPGIPGACGVQSDAQDAKTRMRTSIWPSDGS